jgi:branched-chain amino acid transport system permease protein
VGGAVIGGSLVTNGLVSLALDQWFHVSPSYSALIGGLGLIVTVIANPDGIAGQVRILLERLSLRRHSARAIAALPSPDPSADQSVGLALPGQVKR